MNGLALFSGAGGLELGLRLALGHSYRCVCYVEREAYAAATLVARMEDAALDQAPVWDDVTTFDGRPWRGSVGLVSGGFPCQDISQAGRKEGIQKGNRSGLWFEFARIISEVGPRLVFVENVSALALRGLDVVLGTLADLGFDAEWTTLSAAEMGAPHRRERLFILAHAPDGRRRELRQSPGQRRGQLNGSAQDLAYADHGPRSAQPRLEQGQRPGRVGGHGEAVADSPRISGGKRPGRERILEDDSGVADAERSERRAHAVGGGDPPEGLYEEREATGRTGERCKSLAHTEMRNGGGQFKARGERSGRAGSAGGGADLGDAVQPRSQGSGSPEQEGETVFGAPSLFPPGPGDFHEWGRVVADGSGDFLAPSIKPGLRLLADGVALVVDQSRADQLRLCGNGVVPLVAAAAFRILARRLGVEIHF